MSEAAGDGFVQYLKEAEMEPIVDAQILPKPAKPEGFIYIASPYTDKDPLVREKRYLDVAYVVTTLGRCGIIAYSPIVHWHEVAKTFGLAPDESWLYEHGLYMLRASRATSVLMLEGWARSTGVKSEVNESQRLMRQINYITGGVNAEIAVTINSDKSGPPTA